MSSAVLLVCLSVLVAVEGSLLAKISHSGPNDGQSHRLGKRASIGSYHSYLLVQSVPPNAYMQQFLVDRHNYYRRMAPASNMNMIFWSERLAATAQQHADTCDFNHSQNRVQTGENIWAAPYSNYTDAVRLWYQEVHDPSCNCPHSYKHCCGHYVQVVWAKTYLLGCGFARCRDVQGVRGMGMRNVLVCHYNPQGNTIYPNGGGGWYAEPAFKSADGHRTTACSECEAGFDSCMNGLCYPSAFYRR